ncbi:MAG: hypothetical protein RIF32_22075 [Leptospirales bacterium]
MLTLAGSAAYGLKRYSEARDFLERALQARPDSKALRDALERVRRKL